MKMVFANNFHYLRGGSERVFFEEMELLNENGHELAPFSRHFEENEHSEYSDYFPSPILYENTSFRNKFFSSFKLIYSYESRNNLTKLLKDFAPDLVHAHIIYGRLTSSIMDAAKTSNVPVVMTLHDYKLICPSYLMLSESKACEKCLNGSFYHCMLQRCHKGSLIASMVYTCETYFNRLLKKFDHVSYFISPSNFLLKKHIEAGIPSEKMVYIPNFIAVDHYEPNYDPGNYVLFVGRLSKEKGILTMLKAMQGLKAQLIIVGDGPTRQECESFAQENGLNNVEFAGYKSGNELRDAFRNASFLVFPSEWYENAPMTILEAFAYGKPVIGSNIGGSPDMIVDNETGFLFEPGDYMALREKIEYLFSNPSKTLEMGKKARERVEKEYNADIHYDKLMEVYKRAVS